MSNDDFQDAATFLRNRMSPQQTNALEDEEDGLLLLVPQHTFDR
jgi:hypothetical protein